MTTSESLPDASADPACTQAGSAERRVLLVVLSEELTEGAHAWDGLNAAIGEATKTGQAVAIAVVHDPAAENALSNQLACQSFLGSRQTETVAQLACRSLEERQREALEEAKVRAEAALSMSVQTHFCRGPIREALPKLVRELNPDRVYLPRFSERGWKRVLRRDASHELARTFPCQTIVVES